MIITANISLWCCLGCIAFQDMKQREISWFLIPFLLSILIVKGLLSHESTIFLKDSLLNLGFVIIQLFVLTAYLSLKNKKFVNIINSYIGIGDILFFIVICTAFSPVNFVVFYMTGIILTLLGVILIKAFSKKEIKEIPLAGAISFLMILVLAGSFFISGTDIYNDEHLINLLSIK